MGKGQKLRRQAAEVPMAAGIATNAGIPIPIPIVPTPFRGTPAMPSKPPQPPSASKDAKIALKTPTPTPTVCDEPTDEVTSLHQLEHNERLVIINAMIQTACATALRTSHSMENLSISAPSSNNDSFIKHASSSSALDTLTSSAGLEVPCTGANLYAIVEQYGLISPESECILAALPRLLSSASSAAGVYLIDKLLNVHERSAEAILLPVLGQLWALIADKSPYVRDTTTSISTTLANTVACYTVPILLPALMEAWDHNDWRVRVAALSFLSDISPRASQQVSKQLPVLIPKLAVLAADSKKQVQAAALEALSKSCATITNTDMTPLVQRIVSVIARPEESAATLDCLLETTFVNTVDASSLALMQPLLLRALRHNSTSPLKRKAARVIDNMCRLAQTPADIAPFESMLNPLRKVVDEVCDEEVCQVAREAIAVVETALRTEHSVAATWNSTVIAQDLTAALPDTETTPLTTILLQHLVNMSVGLIEDKNSESSNSDWRTGLQLVSVKQWNDFLCPYARILRDVSAPDFIAQYRRAALGELGELDLVTDDGEEELCNIEFSLAFGGKMLLHNTQLRLCRGHKYGVMAKNGGGKTTLLKNIANGNIEGLPPSLTTVYVQHNEASDNSCSDSVLDELMSDTSMVTAGVSRDAAEAALTQAQFTSTMLSQPRSALSGGWKMKLLVVKAMLAKADVLLLDEPTNHLDTASVEWLVNYLNSQRGVTCLIVSHDPAFLDRVVTDIIHYESMTLVYYPGTLQHFVTLHPEAKFYYELETSTMQFTFPVPGRLDGINSTTKSILKVTNATYTYPGASQPSIKDATVKVCLGSRIAVLGQNGAGKSTLIKLLVQETQPDVINEEENIGVVWKHHNLRVAYVAQHSFHHVEKHLDVSPVDYIKWRFDDGVDREDMNKDTVALTTEEEQRQLKYGDVLQIVGRRKNGRTMEYECVLVGQTIHEDNTYIPMEELIERGFGKLVLQCDARVAAAAAGVNLRPLVIKEIQSHLDDFNLEAEYGTHSKIRLLSGGQKVKLVLAAAMWNKPHVLVLDEPTNYLDREALAALTTAIKAFAGGVVIISHNSEFTDAICTEKWIVRDRQVFVEGEAEQTELKSSSRRRVKTAASSVSEEPAQDKTGNTNKTKAVVELLNNPKTLEKLTSVQVRKLTKLAAAAGLSLKDYVAKINKNSPEWKWL